MTSSDNDLVWIGIYRDDGQFEGIWPAEEWSAVNRAEATPNDIIFFVDIRVDQNWRYVPRGLHDKWKVESDGGAWHIISITGDIIAVDIPFGAYADYIAELHNNTIDIRRMIEK